MVFCKGERLASLLLATVAPKLVTQLTMAWSMPGRPVPLTTSRVMRLRSGWSAWVLVVEEPLLLAEAPVGLPPLFDTLAAEGG